MTHKEAEGSIGKTPNGLLAGEIIFSRQLTLRQLLKLGQESDHKGLLPDVPFDFEVRDLGGSILNIAYFSEKQPLDQSQFFDLLSRAKPGGATDRPPLNQEIGGVLADWKIILPEEREKNVKLKMRYDFHKGNEVIGPYFSEFEENHFKNLYDLLLFSYQKIDFFNSQLERLILKEEFLIKYGINFYQSHKAIDIISQNYSYRQELAEFLNKRSISLDIDPEGISAIDFRDRIKQILLLLSKDKEKELLGDFYKELSGKMGEIDLALYAADTLGFDIMVDENGEPYDYTRFAGASDWLGLSKGESIKNIGNGEIEIRRGESYIIVGFKKDADGRKKLFIKEEHIHVQVSPAIIWERNKTTNEASYFCGKVPELPHHDSLAGQLLVSAHSPKQRDQMSKEITFIRDGKEVKQQMREAQIVLLVPMHQKLFLTESPVILRLEALARQSNN